MGKAKKWIAAITALSLAAFGGYRGLLYLKERNSPEVPVVDVASLITEDYFSYDSADTSLSGSIATNVVQNIRIDKDIIVRDLLVNVGDEVKKGDLLMTIDTTLTEMELGIAELEHQRIQQNLDKAKDRLYSLQNGGPIEEDTGTGDEMDAGADSTDGYEIIEGDDLAFSGRAGGSDGSPYLAAAFPIVLAADLLTDGDSFDKSEGELLSGDLVDSGAEEMAPAENIDIGITDTIEPWLGEENYLADDISADAGQTPEGENLSEEILVDDSSLTEGELTSDGDLLSDDGLASDEMLISDDGELISEDPAAVTIITPTPVPTDTPVPTATPEPTPSADPYDYHFYDVLDSNSKAWVGDGTEEFPFVFLTTSETGYVVLKGSFLNRMMGYDPEGKEIVHEGGYWYCVEYYLDSVIEDPENREASRFGYYLMNGGEDRLVDVQGVVSDVGDENTYSGEDEYYDDEYYDGEYYDGEGEYYDDTYFSEDEFAYRAADGETDDLDDGFVNYEGGEEEEGPWRPEYERLLYFIIETGYNDDIPVETPFEWDEPIEDTSEPSGTSMTRDEAIRQKELEIKTLEFSLKESEVKLNTLRRKCETKELFARIDGTISYTGNPDTGTSSMDSFLRVKSKEGFFVTGQVSEMMLDQIDAGTVIQCTTDMGETFDAEVIDVADYPDSSSTTDTFYSSGNPNASTYSFTASIADQDQDLALSEDTWLTSVVIPGSMEEQSSGLTINKAFVRSENGKSYVMKEEDGVLKKQYVRVGKVDQYGYTITITGGLRRSDKLAFPYSQKAVEGAKTVDGTLDQMYGADSMMYY